jgi:molybdate transport system ATP-binding protein
LTWQPPLVELREVTVLLNGKRIFPRTSWAIHSGEHWAILGPNGSGKTALAMAVAGHLPVVDGDIVYPPGIPMQSHIRHVSFGDQRTLIARFSQYLQGRYESLEGEEAPTAAELLGATPHGSPSRRELLGRLGLEGILSRHVLHLSNGEMRKLLIAQAILDRPRLLILDEPLLGLDQACRRELRRLLRQTAEQGVTLLLVAARREHVLPLVSRVLCLRDGKIVGQGRRRDLAPTGRLAGCLSEAARPAQPIRLPIASLRHGSGETLVELREVTVRREGVEILRNVSWTIRGGEHWGLFGPNGAGKTTLLSLILADHPQAYANEVRVFGHRRGDGASIWEIKRRLGHVSPEAQIHFHAGTVLEAVCSGFFDSIGLYRSCSAPQLRKTRAWARALDLGPLLDRPFATLSEGQKRLALIARALVKAPRLLILDEPCQGLDEEHRRRVIEIVDRLARDGACSVLYVTHEPEEFPAAITHLMHLERGRVVRAGRI